MFDLPLPIHPTAQARGVPPHFPSCDTDPNYPFGLTLSRRAPADLLSGRAASLVLARFATLADAMQGAIDHSEGMAPDAALQLLRSSTATTAWCWPGPPATTPSPGATRSRAQPKRGAW